MEEYLSDVLDEKGYFLIFWFFFVFINLKVYQWQGFLVISGKSNFKKLTKCLNIFLYSANSQFFVFTFSYQFWNLPITGTPSTEVFYFHHFICNFKTALTILMCHALWIFFFKVAYKYFIYDSFFILSIAQQL